MSTKKSIRFFNDHKVRAVWSDADNKWYFSATDVVRAINDEEDYVKAGNYWRWLKKKLAAEGVQLVSDTHDFKFEAPDGKMRKADWKDGTLFCRAEYLKHSLEQIANREIFMKGIDYSYYYEQQD